MTSWQESHDQIESWSQLLLGGLSGEIEAVSYGFNSDHFTGSEDNELGVKHEQQAREGFFSSFGHETSSSSSSSSSRPPWTQRTFAASSPRSSSLTSTSFTVSNILDFSKKPQEKKIHAQQDDYSKCNSSPSEGSGFKKAKVQVSSATGQTSSLMVRKEKLGERITAIHQLVSPFGKTDTASVLQEAIGYIRFLQAQIEALCSPFLFKGSLPPNYYRKPSARGERNCIFPEDPGQLLDDNGAFEIRQGSNKHQNGEEEVKDLRSRGLCLVPVSYTVLHLGVGSGGGRLDGVDYLSPAFISGSGR